MGWHKGGSGWGKGGGRGLAWGREGVVQGREGVAEGRKGMGGLHQNHSNPRGPLLNYNSLPRRYCNLEPVYFLPRGIILGPFPSILSGFSKLGHSGGELCNKYGKRGVRFMSSIGCFLNFNALPENFTNFECIAIS